MSTLTSTKTWNFSDSTSFGPVRKETGLTDALVKEAGH